MLSINYLPLDVLLNKETLDKYIYSNMFANYYWSDDFSPKYYIAQAKAGFIAVTEHYKNQELLIPEIQFNYAILDFKDLHISKKVKKLLKKENLKLIIDENLEEVFSGISSQHNSWLTTKYLQTLKATKNVDKDFKVVSAYIKQNNIVVAGEIGYIIGKTYTSLSGFTIRDKKYNNYGKAQLVLLAKYLEKNHFNFWNLGHPHMPYKLALGAKIYTREEFLKRWYKQRF